jgi:inner membrane protein
MQKRWFGRFGVVGMVFVLLLIPITLINGLVDERAQRQRGVAQEIAASSYGRLTLAGPILSIPYREEYEEWVYEDKEKHPERRRLERRRVDRVVRVFPDTQDMAGDVAVSSKSRGIFKARIFEWRGRIDGEFVLDGNLAPDRTHAGSSITWGRPFLSIALGDPRGLGDLPDLRWEGQPLKLERGSRLAHLSGGVSADIPAFNVAVPFRARFSLQLALNGSESLSVVPLSGGHRIALKSDWPHPSFGGQFLPRQYQPGERGFEGQWSIAALASKSQQQVLQQIAGQNSCPADNVCADRMEVRFVEPIDIYSLSDRALKYGFLFIGLTFASFILIEVLTGIRIHPAQYFLVGLALALFFLLLISLSEHIAFGAAYAIAAAACVALLGFYLHAVLRGGWRGTGFTAMLGALYAALYGLLISEDNALLLGSLLVFGLLALVMMLTRRLDWYALGEAGLKSTPLTHP